MENYTVFIIQGAELFLSLLNLVLTIVIIKEFKANERQNTSREDDDEIIKLALCQKRDFKMKRHQIRILALGLFLYAAVFATLSIIADTIGKVHLHL